MNHAYPLARVGEQSLKEIWQGVRLAALRRSLERGDFSLGCQECGAQRAEGNRAWSNAPQFDRFESDAVPDYPRRMDFVLSNTCNLMCEMCNGYLSSAIRARREHLPPLPSRYDDTFFAELEEFLPHLEEAVFLGGEPFLAREPRRVWDLMLALGVSPRIQVVSNGTQWNDRVERYLTELPMNVAVSVDGFSAATVESLRSGVDHATLVANIDRYEAAVSTHGGGLGYHYCLMVQNWHEFGRFLVEAESRNRYVQVMTVTTPARFSLFHLPGQELAEVLAALEHESQAVVPHLHELRPTWDAELDRIRRHLAQLDHGARPTWVSVPRPRRVGDSDQRDHAEELTSVSRRADEQLATTRRLEGEIACWAGRPSLVLRGEDGVITACDDAPPWAEDLDPDGLVGVPVTALHDALAIRLGRGANLSFVEGPHDHLLVSATYGEGQDATALRAVASESADPDGRNANRVAIAVRGLAREHELQ